MVRAEGGQFVRGRPQALGYEVVAAAYHCDGGDGGVEQEGAEPVVDEVAAGVQGYDHCVDVWGFGEGDGGGGGGDGFVGCGGRIGG